MPSFSQEDQREDIHMYNEKGEIENLEPTSWKFKSRVPLIRHVKCGMEVDYYIQVNLHIQN